MTIADLRFQSQQAKSAANVPKVTPFPKGSTYGQMWESMYGAMPVLSPDQKAQHDANVAKWERRRIDAETYEIYARMPWFPKAHGSRTERLPDGTQITRWP